MASWEGHRVCSERLILVFYYEFLCNIAKSLHLKNAKKQILIIFVYIYFRSDYAAAAEGKEDICWQQMLPSTRLLCSMH